MLAVGLFTSETFLCNADVLAHCDEDIVTTVGNGLVDLRKMKIQQTKFCNQLLKTHHEGPRVLYALSAAFLSALGA